MWFLDNKKTSELSDEINDNIEVTESTGGEVVKQETKENDPYLDLINMNLSNVDFTKLKKMNSDSVGFI